MIVIYSIDNKVCSIINAITLNTIQETMVCNFKLTMSFK